MSDEQGRVNYRIIDCMGPLEWEYARLKRQVDAIVAERDALAERVRVLEEILADWGLDERSRELMGDTDRG